MGREAKVAGRPDSTEARVVVSGGRAIKNAEDFERLIGGLADVLGGAVGSSRALVDSGHHAELAASRADRQDGRARTSISPSASPARFNTWPA